MSIRKDLEEMGDKKCAEFSAKLTPNVNPKLFIGIKVPKLREYAKKIQGTKEADDFLKKLPHKYHEENMLHSILLNTIKDYDKEIEEKVDELEKDMIKKNKFITSSSLSKNESSVLRLLYESTLYSTFYKPFIIH